MSNTTTDLKNLPTTGSERVVITGIGIVSTIGATMLSFTQALKDGKCGIRSLESSGLFSNPLIAAMLDPLSFEEKLQKFDGISDELLRKAKRCAKRAPVSVQASILSTLEAYAHADLRPDFTNRISVCLIIAGHNISQNYSFDVYRKYQSQPEYVTPSYALHFMDTDHIGIVSEIFQLRGEGFTVGGASASGNVGIIQAYRQIKYGLADLCILVGPMADLSPLEFHALANIGAMGGKKYGNAPEKACRPFDMDREGFIYGQGSGCMILESETSAANRGAYQLGEVAGGAMVLDGNRLSNPSLEGEIGAMTKALQETGISAHEIDYLNAHGTSSKIGDETEINAIKTVYKDSLSSLWVNSTKGLTGHCLYASGIIEAIATLVQVNGGFLHPNINLDTPIDAMCRFVGSKMETAPVSTAMSNAFGFGGINTAVILKKGCA